MKKAWLALVFGSALFLAACGGDDDKDTTTPADDNANETEDVANDDATTNEGTTDEGTTDEGATTDEGTTEGADEATIAKGEEVVKQSCTSCHGGNLQGQGSAFPALDKLGEKMSEEEILKIINEGIPGTGMPGGLVKGEDAEAAAAYLATLK